MKPMLAALVLAAAVLPCTVTSAGDIVRGDLRIAGAYARAMPPGARTAGAYLAIENRGRDPDKLVGARSARAGAVELHAMRDEGGVMRMRELRDIEVPAGRTVRLEPGGLHLMLVDPKAPLRAGERVPLTLEFARAGAIDVELDVQPLTAGGSTHTH